MLKVYATNWCPHCQAAVNYLKTRAIPFEFVDMDAVDPATEQKVVEVNGGDDWLVPTLENDGRWIPGEPFNEAHFAKLLKQIGVADPC